MPMPERTGDDTRELRRFGVGAGALLVVLVWVVLPWWRGAARPPWALATGLALIALGLAWPRAVHPLYRAWRPLGRLLALVNTWLLLVLVFFVLLVPLGAVLRRTGRLQYRSGFDPHATSYRVDVERGHVANLEEPF
jgi:hypothetical protein